ncbi:MAG: hypothetical protein OEZ22_07165 [Spirochaetia bacterium]|nr:hypothetical protein [Spirochaetia bacterium]
MLQVFLLALNLFQIRKKGDIMPRTPAQVERAIKLNLDKQAKLKKEADSAKNDLKKLRDELTKAKADAKAKAVAKPKAKKKPAPKKK